MALRPKLGPGSGVIPGTTFFEEYQPAMKGLFDAANFPLTNIGGSPNDVTADLHWDLDAGLVDGMKFTLTWAASNSGPMTLKIGDEPAKPLVDRDGTAMLEAGVSAGRRSLIEYSGGEFRVLTGAAGGDEADPRYWQITASTTWEKPVDLPDNAMVFVEAWGGGGGGGGETGTQSSGGGGGGGYISGWFRAADLPSSISVTVGAGGAQRAAGGTTTFGSFLQANGGLPGGSAPATAEGGGAGVENLLTPLWKGGGGGSAPPHAVYGGGGGQRSGSGAEAGRSLFGGDGGAPGNPPGGGGSAWGGSGGNPGARGEVRIWIWQ